MPHVIDTGAWRTWALGLAGAAGARGWEYTPEAATPSAIEVDVRWSEVEASEDRRPSRHRRDGRFQSSIIKHHARAASERTFLSDETWPNLRRIP